MSKQTQQFFEQLKGGQEPSLVETVKEAAASLKEIGGQLWDGMKPMFDHGRTEAAAALFSGHGHVLYMKGQEGVEQGQDQVQSPDVGKGIENEQSRGGIEM
jgi:hypothetical protein